MNEDYQQLRQEADKIYHHFNDRVDDKNAVAGLAQDVREIVEDFEMQKKPRSIEDHIKRVQQQLRSFDTTNTRVMDAGDIDDLVDRYEDLRQELHELDNY